jgi:signal peptidase II
MNIFWFTTFVSILVSTLSFIVANTFLHERVPIIGSFVGLSLSTNPGFAFGLSLAEPLQTILICFAFIGVLYLAFTSTKTVIHQVSFGLICGGAIGNLIDRFLDGVVTDFFQIGQFPVFNTADSLISVGVTLLLWSLVKKT